MRIIALVWLCALGCDRGWRVQGQVLRAGSRAGVEGEALPGALVRVQCRAGDRYAARGWARVGPDGRFDVKDVGFLHMDCRIVVSADGYRATELVVRDVCAEPYDERECDLARVRAVLAPD